MLSKKLNNAQNLTRIVPKIIVGILRFLFIFGLCYLFIFPLFYLIVAAFQDPLAAKDPTVVWIPKSLSLDNFKLAFDQMKYVQSAVLTTLISVLSTLATLLSCSMAGYGFARFKFKEKNIAFLFVILLIIVPPPTTMLSSYMNFHNFDFFGIMKLLAPITGIDHINLLNTVWVFVLPALLSTGLRSGLFIFIFRQFFAGQPKELEEAAKIDGCNAFQTFIKIMAPLAVPAFITVILFSFIWHWNENYISSMYFADTIKPLSVQLTTMRSTFLNDTANAHYTITAMRGALAAGALGSILPALILYIFTQKYFTESIERAGIVG